LWNIPEKLKQMRTALFSELTLLNTLKVKTKKKTYKNSVRTAQGHNFQ
jgi:hypothetical protein